MSSRKNLKRTINNTFGDLYADCIFYKVYVVNSDAKAADEMINKIVAVHNDILGRMSASEGKDVKGRVKAYYKNLREHLKQQVDALGAEITKLP